MQKQFCVLLVDDDADDTALFKEVLFDIEPGVDFRSALDGCEAIDLLDNDPTNLPDIIFLDLNMPRMDGKECLKILKTDSIFKDIPVIIYTTSTQSRDIEETMVSGASCFITKPTQVKELREIITAVVKNTNADVSKAFGSLSKGALGYIVC